MPCIFNITIYGIYLPCITIYALYAIYALYTLYKNTGYSGKKYRVDTMTSFTQLHMP